MRRPAIERLLPAAYQRAVRPGGVLAALLDVMEGMHGPSEERLASVDDLFSPYRTPPGFVPFLAGWLAFDHVTSGPATAGPAMAPGRLRDLVATAATLAQWRGTAAGLQALIDTAAGVAGARMREQPDRPFHIVVRVPPAAHPQLDLIRLLVETEKPAAVTCEVVLDGDSLPDLEGEAR
jgi:phage tail-like protein